MALVYAQRYVLKPHCGRGRTSYRTLLACDKRDRSEGSLEYVGIRMEAVSQPQIEDDLPRGEGDNCQESSHASLPRREPQP